MKTTVPILLILAVLAPAESKVDSLETVVQARLEANLHDRTTLKKMNTLVRELVRTDMSKAQDWGFKALDLGQGVGRTKELADVYNSVGWVFRSQGLHHIALEYYSKALQMYEDLDIKDAFAWNQISIGNVYFKLETMDLAIMQYQRAFELFNEIGDTNGMAISMSNIGMVEEANGENQKALDHYIKARKIRSHLPTSFAHSYDTYQVGHGYLIIGDLAKAKQYFHEALALAKQFSSTDNIARAYLGLGEVQEQLGLMDSALVHYQHSAEAQDPSQAAQMHRKIAELQYNNKRYGTALSSAEKAISLAREHKLLEEEAEAFKLMSDIYLQLDLPFKSIESLQDHVAAMESLGRSDVTEAVTRMEVIQKEERQEKELALKEAELAAQRVQRNMAIIIAALLMTIAVGLILRYRFIKKMSKQLVEGEKKIHEQQLSIETHEKEKLNRELDIKRRELTGQAVHSAQHREFMNSLRKDLVTMDANGNSDHGLLKKFISRIDDDLASKDEWKEFDTWFSEVHGQFFDVLDEKYPNLSSTERKLCAFLKLNMNIKEVAALTNLAPKTIEVYRSRLRKKLNIPRDQNLVNFITRL